MKRTKAVLTMLLISLAAAFTAPSVVMADPVEDDVGLGTGSDIVTVFDAEEEVNSTDAPEPEATPEPGATPDPGEEPEITRELPYYFLSGSYDEEAKKYTINVYLYSDCILDAGSLGIKFDDGIKDKTKKYMPYNFSTAIGFTENGVTWGLEYNDATGFDEVCATNITDQFAYSWNAPASDDELQAIYTSDGTDIPYKILCGRLEVENVELKELNTQSFVVLDWMTTDMYQNETYVHQEIWREGYPSEKAENIKGYYQGQKHVTLDPDTDNWGWIDIGVYFISDVPLQDPDAKDLTIHGTISGYNKNFRFMVYLYQEGVDITASDPIYTFDSSENPYSAKVTTDRYGWTTWEMELEDISMDYKYQMVIRKMGHLQYPTIEVDPADSEDTDRTLTVGDISLICGDLDNNGVIKLRDRIQIMRLLNRQILPTTIGYDLEDLDGIGGVNLVDLSILKKNFETSYDAAVLTKAVADTSAGGGTPTPTETPDPGGGTPEPSSEGGGEI